MQTVKEYRAEHGLTIKQMAELLGIHEPNVYRAERLGSGYGERLALVRIERLLADRPGPVSAEVRKIALEALGRGGE